MNSIDLIPYEHQIQIANILTQYASAMEEHALTLNKPHLLYKPKVYKDGDTWFALLGENIQEGVVGMGKNPGEAMLNFDNAWNKIGPAR